MERIVATRAELQTALTNVPVNEDLIIRVNTRLLKMTSNLNLTSGNEDYSRVSIKGLAPINVTLQSLVEAEKQTFLWGPPQGGSPYSLYWGPQQTFCHYLVTYQLNTVNNIQPGDFLIIRTGGTTTNPYTYLHFGAHEILEVNQTDNQVTALNYCHLNAELDLGVTNPLNDPANFSGNVSAKVIRSKIWCALGAQPGNSGFSVSKPFGALEDLVIVGSGYPAASKPAHDDVESNRSWMAYRDGDGFRRQGLVVFDDGEATLGSSAAVTGFSNGGLVVNEGMLTFQGCVGGTWSSGLGVARGECVVDGGICHGTYMDGAGARGDDDNHGKLYSSATSGKIYSVGNARAGITLWGGNGAGTGTGELHLITVGNGMLLRQDKETGADKGSLVAGLSIERTGTVVRLGGAYVAANPYAGIQVTNGAEVTGTSDQRVLVTMNRHQGIRVIASNPEFTKLRAIRNGLEANIVPNSTSCDMHVNGVNPNGATAKLTVTEILENAANVVTNPPRTAPTFLTRFDWPGI